MNLNDKLQEMIGKFHTQESLLRDYGQPVMMLGDNILGYSLPVAEGEIKIIVARQEDNSYKTIDAYLI